MAVPWDRCLRPNNLESLVRLSTHPPFPTFTPSSLLPPIHPFLPPSPHSPLPPSFPPEPRIHPLLYHPPHSHECQSVNDMFKRLNLTRFATLRYLTHNVGPDEADIYDLLGA
eukprot:GHVU01176652.1.p2 GENE.GHVU01176652.1~~GHVU01176652.1.p2  ORF type:complete len:112 (+),score=7.24 GHVU01176652.1:963-1298(+)